MLILSSEINCRFPNFFLREDILGGGRGVLPPTLLLVNVRACVHLRLCVAIECVVSGSRKVISRVTHSSSGQRGGGRERAVEREREIIKKGKTTARDRTRATKDELP